MIGENQRVSPKQMEKIRKLNDFDLTMLISEIDDHGWQVASCTLDMMPVDGAMPDKKVVEEACKRSREILKTRLQKKG